jgi:hypothetical protein
VSGNVVSAAPSFRTCRLSIVVLIQIEESGSRILEARLRRHRDGDRDGDGDRDRDRDRGRGRDRDRDRDRGVRLRRRPLAVHLAGQR